MRAKISMYCNENLILNHCYYEDNEILLKLYIKPVKVVSNIDISRPNMDLRSRPKVKLKNNFTAITKVYNSPHYRGMRLWDKLPPTLQKEENNIKFKTEINRYVWK